MKSYSNVQRAVKARRPQSIHAGSSLFYVILFCLSLISAQSAHAQNTAVSGHIVDGRGKAIVGAQVDLTNAATHEVIKSLTNGDGYFQFPPVAPGSYTVHANAPGFAPYTLDRVMK
jgi:protocatechuate 3,4-dioxygenase beta subunit